MRIRDNKQNITQQIPKIKYYITIILKIVIKCTGHQTITILLTELRRQEFTNSPFGNSVTKSIGRVIYHSPIFILTFSHKLTKGIIFPEILNKTHQNICGTGKM
jgi:hypothetical protein